MNKKALLRPALGLLMITAAVAWVHAAEEQAFLDPAKAGPDYAIQGEFAGPADNGPVGAQVWAMGGHKFHAVFVPGGLPGAGGEWDIRQQADGETGPDGKTTFGKPGVGWSGTISADGKKFEGVSASTGEKFHLTKLVRESKTMGKKPPEGAVVLFDGKSADAWNGGKVTPEGNLEGGTVSKQSFGDCTIHLEFRTPFKPEARGQARGNSGVYVQNRYEIQVLDSFGLSGENNECGGIYHDLKPLINMCLPPLQWQTYDVDFEAAKFDGSGKKTKNAVITLWHNGFKVHNAAEIHGSTPGGQPEAATPGPIQLQAHGNPVVFRNIWVVEKK